MNGAIVLGISLLLVFLWFLWRNRARLGALFIFRHLLFISLIYLGCLSFLYGAAIDRLIFGREIHKGEPEEIIAGLIFLVGPILFFAIAAIALGRNRASHFKLYLETFRFGKRGRDG